MPNYDFKLCFFLCLLIHFNYLGGSRFRISLRTISHRVYYIKVKIIKHGCCELKWFIMIIILENVLWLYIYWKLHWRIYFRFRHRKCDIVIYIQFQISQITGRIVIIIIPKSYILQNWQSFSFSTHPKLKEFMYWKIVTTLH